MSLLQKVKKMEWKAQTGMCQCSSSTFEKSSGCTGCPGHARVKRNDRADRLFQRQHWRNSWEVERIYIYIYGPSRALRYHLELNWTELNFRSRPTYPTLCSSQIPADWGGRTGRKWTWTVGYGPSFATDGPLPALALGCSPEKQKLGYKRKPETRIHAVRNAFVKAKMCWGWVFFQLTKTVETHTSFFLVLYCTKPNRLIKRELWVIFD